jgi:FtsP/CotA-like multicopper oxidase with cupredoxin domain
VLGVDGGIQERPTRTDILLITAGERVDVIVTTKGVEYRSVEDVLTIEFSKDAPVTASRLR